MLSDKEPRKNIKPTLPPFKLLEKNMEARQVPTRLIVGMAMPFAVVILILFIFSKKTPTVSSPATPALPVAISSPVAETQLTIKKPIPPSPPIPVRLIEARPKSPMEKAASQTHEKREQDLTFFKTLKDGPDVKQPLKASSPVKTTLKSNKAGQPAMQASAKVINRPQIPLPPPLPVRPVSNLLNVKTTPPPDIKKSTAIPPKGKTNELLSKDKPISPSQAKQETAVKTAPKKETAPVHVPQVMGKGGLFTIQVGAFQQKEEAEQLAFRLKEHGYDAYVVLANIPNKGIWHRVRVGHYKERDFATQAGEKLAQVEHLAFHVTPN
jgi:cell division septation protein DedD